MIPSEVLELTQAYGKQKVMDVPNVRNLCKAIGCGRDQVTHVLDSFAHVEAAAGQADCQGSIMSGDLEDRAAHGSFAGRAMSAHF